MNQLPEQLPALVGLFVGGLIVFVAAVWFGLRVLAPRIGRALDRADADEESGREDQDGIAS
jgi:hypothetical protein